MGLKLKIVPSITIDPSPGELTPIGFSSDSSLSSQGISSALWHHNHTVLSSNVGLTTIGYEDVSAIVKDTFSISGGGYASEFNDLIFVGHGNDGWISSYYVNPSTGEISEWAYNDVSAYIFPSRLAGTTSRLVSTSQDVGYKILASFSSDASGNLTFDVSIHDVIIDDTTDGITSNGNNIVYWSQRDGSQEGAYIRSFKVTAGSITNVDTNYILNEGYAAVIYGFPHCTSTRLAVVNQNYGGYVYLYDINEDGSMMNRLDVSAGDPAGAFLACSNESDYFITERFDSEPWLGQYAGVNIYDISSGEYIIDVSTPSGKWNSQYGKNFINDSSLQFSLNFTNYTENFTIDLSLRGGGDASIVTGPKLLIVPDASSVLLIAPPLTLEQLFSFITTDTSLSGLNVTGPTSENNPTWVWGDGNTTEGTGYVTHEYTGGYVSPAEKTVTYSLFTPSVASALIMSGQAGDKNVIKSLDLTDFSQMITLFANHIVLEESLDLSNLTSLSNLSLTDSSVYGNLDLTNNTSISGVNATDSAITGMTFDTGTEYPSLYSLKMGDASITASDVSVFMDYLYDNSTMFTNASKQFDLRTTGDPVSRGATRRAFDLFAPDTKWTFDNTAFGSQFTAPDGIGSLGALSSFDADFTFGYSPIYQQTSGSKYPDDILGNSLSGVSGEVYMSWRISMDCSLADFQSSSTAWRLKIMWGVNAQGNNVVDDTTYTFTTNTSGMEFDQEVSTNFTLPGAQYYNIVYEIYLFDSRADKTQDTGDHMEFQVDVSIFNLDPDDDLIIDTRNNTRRITITRDYWGA